MPPPANPSSAYPSPGRAASDQFELTSPLLPAELCRALRGRSQASVLIDGSGGYDHGWDPAPLVAVEPVVRLAHRSRRGIDGAIARLGRLVAERRARGGVTETGVLALIAYEADATAGRCCGEGPEPLLVAICVDRSVRFRG